MTRKHGAGRIPPHRLATRPRHSFNPGGRHRAVVQPGWVRMNVMLAAMIWWLGIGGITG